MTIAEVEAALSTSASGLSPAEAARRLHTNGPNVLEEERPPGLLALGVRQLKSALIWVLLVAAGLSVATGDLLEAAAIIAIVALNAVLGSVQESRAERALAALRQMSVPHARVRREGRIREIQSREIVSGDVYLLEAGDVVPADGRIIEAWDLEANEAVLTGEFLPEAKSPSPVPGDAMLADRPSMTYQGTAVTRGRGVCFATATGGETEMGRIAGLLKSARQEATPLQRQLDRFGNLLVLAALLVALVVLVTGMIRGIDTVEMVLIAVSLAVAAIPEGLPASATIVLALGVQRIARMNVIVRRLSSVETLGAVTTIFTDKTGTLTQNRMTVREVWPADSEAILQAMVLCNDAVPGEEGRPASGDPTETALLDYAMTRGMKPLELRARWPRSNELPFESSRAMMSVVAGGDDGPRVFTKGAPEAVFSRCRWNNEGLDIAAAKAAVERMTSTGLRVLAFATKPYDGGEIEAGLDLIGIAALGDRLRPEAPAALAAARERGLRSVMLTGDHPSTARAIGAELGLEGDALTGRDIEGLSKEELAAKLDDAEVFARVTSEDKLRFIEAARHRGEIVAMTGDGVNDAPALRAADVGIAMGEGGTDVAREASDLVLVDNSFASIVAAISEGRHIYANIRRFVHFLLSCNAGEIAVIFLGVMVWSESPFTPLQILFVNLLTDGLPALALGLEPREEAAGGSPRRSGSALVSWRSLTPILGVGGSVAAVTIAAYALGRSWEGEELARSLALATLIGAHLLASFVFRNERQWAFALPMNWFLVTAAAASLAFLVLVYSLAPLQDTFEVTPLSASEAGAALVLSLAPLLAAEAVKASGVLARWRLLPADSS
jgi:Ca2+-transporting ATPase